MMMESADVLSDEIEGRHASKNDMLAMEERLKRYAAEQTNKIVAITLGGIAVGVAIVSILIVVT